MRPPASAISRRSIKTIWLCLSLGGVLVLLTSCSESADPLPDAVIAQLDRTNNTIADLNADGDELPANVLLQSVLRAEVAGTTLRIVVAAPSGEFVSAKSVVDRYGGTAISYQSERATFEGASQDMTGSQLERAVGAAKVQSDIGESAAALRTSSSPRVSRSAMAPWFGPRCSCCSSQLRCSCCRVLGLICRHENGASGGITSS